jgi:D-alanyl-D-alanine dipeptidase
MDVRNYRSTTFIKVILFMTLSSNITLQAEKNASLVLVSSINSTIRYDLMYATTRNFTGKVIYTQAKAYLIKEAACALNAVQEELTSMGLGLLIWDAYRPLSAQHTLWSVCSDPRYVADPSKGGYHTRGIAVDVTLVRLSDGSLLEMPTGFDDFSEKASRNYKGNSLQANKNSELLKDVMVKHGFNPFVYEWWHFNYGEVSKYPPLDIDFELLT